ncbi:MAG: serine--tRNA ligase [Deltaproteobacteria bacterium]|nr:serine--tRNA ligase [Deltaproteobacteria bacterium]MBW1747326.1 serine--tRNA ligase [Deltaproteobacteria bacterium]MBW1827294.1 serine--tRNA ligase [Deltaproteobacteria bacterium]MBW1969050.1 serine--tRNA ligase [Deltaproteobacteria bacterium]MBW2157483.1 serine--tRNA ligase [Deltaproteobacteria bacterium]
MLEIKFVRQNLEKIEISLANRGDTADLETFKDSDTQRKSLLLEIETLRHRRNVVSEKIAGMKKNGEDADDLVTEMREVGGRIKTLELHLTENEEKINQILFGLPNLPHTSVPIGKDSSENPVLKKTGTPPDFDFEPLPHWTLGENLKILDFETASKITGARFPLYLGAGAKLERALINFMLDIHTTEHGYKEILPPFMVNRDSMTNTGQLPKFEKDLFKLEGWDYFMVPTAEVPVTNIHKGEILDEDMLPILYTAYTPCFRSEAGSHGKDTRGLIRQHQFNKVELVKFTRPETSYDELETLLNNAEKILKYLGLPYQVINLCTGDLGFSAAKTYDIEVWMPAQGVYREISSCSNFESFQARRASIRFKRKGKKGTELVHTLNGSGLAVGRTFAAVLENFQQADGSVIIPEALRPYMGGMEKLVP